MRIRLGSLNMLIDLINKTPFPEWMRMQGPIPSSLESAIDPDFKTTGWDSYYEPKEFDFYVSGYFGAAGATGATDATANADNGDNNGNSGNGGFKAPSGFNDSNGFDGSNGLNGSNGSNGSNGYYGGGSDGGKRKSPLRNNFRKLN
ncbi:hypothetical protein HELRODRAFT_180403 [Helobdella robusta]|uniref:Uncharacterized protein n=1 Tax=Helobdella robusta TaxID=6412 RepID=T1FFV8_HELRO|nr:hypothetical protein HELRODRAFT_180403 [Helobdella robusta]ESN93984.1 hypothetical protein HELRODRAFT_180403 [Helobdella robusta]